MNPLTQILRAAAGIAAAALLIEPLAGCSGGASTLPGAPLTSSSAPVASAAAALEPQKKKKKVKGLLYVSDNENNKVLVFSTAGKTQNPPALRTITSGIQGPNGMTTDESGNLYVANYVNSTVTVYAPNASTPKATISNGLSGPFDVKVDAFGNVYVANDPLSGAAPFIQLYPSGSSSPSYTWTAPQRGMVISGLALLDPTVQGQTAIYATEYIPQGSGGAVGGLLSCYPGNSTCISFGTGLGQTGGIAVAESPGMNQPFQYLAVDEYIPGIDIYTLGAPTQQLTTGGTPEFIALDSTDTKLFVADRFHGKVTEYSYPSGQSINSFTSGGQTYGVATYPAGTYH
jgi:hypothetical protein